VKTLESRSLVLLHHHLKALRLPTIGAECEKVAARCAADNHDHLRAARGDERRGGAEDPASEERARFQHGILSCFKG